MVTISCVRNGCAMDCAKYLDSSNVLLDLRGTTREEVVAELVDAICRGGDGERATLLESIYGMDGIGNTPVGQGVAIPHGKTDTIPGLRMAFGRSIRGVRWESPDGPPVHMVWLIVNPGHQADEYLNILSQLSKISFRSECREAIMRAGDHAEVVRIVSDCRHREKARP